MFTDDWLFNQGMLYSQRRAVERMGRWAPAHMVIWAVYSRLGLWNLPPVRWLWFRYRKLWP
jgi:hypothetical protein